MINVKRSKNDRTKPYLYSSPFSSKVIHSKNIIQIYSDRDSLALSKNEDTV